MPGERLTRDVCRAKVTLAKRHHPQFCSAPRPLCVLRSTEKGGHLTAPKWGLPIVFLTVMDRFCDPFFCVLCVENRFYRKSFGFLAQVTAGYTWCSLLESLCPPTKSVTRINLDESAVKIWMAPGKGLIARSSLNVVRGARCISPATLKQQRVCLTHFVFVCDKTSIQVYLLHVTIGNEAVLQLYIQREIEPQLFSNVYSVRRKSARVDAGYMAVIIALLGKILKPFLGTVQPILLMDALPARVAQTVFRAAARCGFWVVVVPAKLTWLIQPADTHAFYTYKLYFKSGTWKPGPDLLRESCSYGKC